MLDSLAALKEILFSITLTDALILSLNIILFILAKRILQLFYHETENSRRFKMRAYLFRLLNILIFILYLYHYVQFPAERNGWDFKFISAVGVIYIGYIIQHISIFYIQSRFGKEREINGEKRSIETYNTRLLSILANVFISVIVLISVIRVLGFESWLEAGGVIGFIGVFLALTHSAWAPDIFSGLIILNSGLVEEGDVIELQNGSVLGVVFKTKMFHTEILNIVNNHRIMMGNSALRKDTLHNLSRFASAKGLREKLSFNIGYDESMPQIKVLFENAFKDACDDSALTIEEQYPIEIHVGNTGDYAVQWNVYYYTKNVKHMLKTRQMFLEIILRHALDMGISLATPVLNNVKGNLCLPNCPE